MPALTTSCVGRCKYWDLTLQYMVTFAKAEAGLYLTGESRVVNGRTVIRLASDSYWNERSSTISIIDIKQACDMFT